VWISSSATRTSMVLSMRELKKGKSQ